MAADATSAAPDAAEEYAAQRVEELRDENAQLQQAVHAHAVVDQAIGVVIAVGRLTPEQGWEVLRRVSQHTNIKVRTVAEHVVGFARTQELPAELNAELQRQIAHAARTSGPGGHTSR
ncbi:ANTAR domain-containing protein [Streptomyces anthocyanicus]|uniref:ANTAR domain-containing protein n=1 Tax=Streptomyces TaxID=1883 RepID=UPI00364F20F4